MHSSEKFFCCTYYNLHGKLISFDEMGDIEIVKFL